MGSTGWITGGPGGEEGPPKPKPAPIPIAAPTPAKANAPSTPVAPTATSPIAEVPSGVTTPACSPNSIVTSPVGFGQTKVSIFPFASMIAVLTSPFFGGTQPRRVRRSESCSATSVMLVPALFRYSPGSVNVVLPTAAAEHVAVAVA